MPSWTSSWRRRPQPGPRHGDMGRRLAMARLREIQWCWNMRFTPGSKYRFVTKRGLPRMTRSWRKWWENDEKMMRKWWSDFGEVHRDEDPIGASASITIYHHYFFLTAQKYTQLHAVKCHISHGVLVDRIIQNGLVDSRAAPLWWECWFRFTPRIYPLVN